MKVCVAQTNPVKGNIEKNIKAHVQLIRLAAGRGAAIIVFPELSVTGYEPTLAKELAISPFDSRLQVFQQLSDENNMVICAGMPLQSGNGVLIGMVIFQPQQQRTTYCKQYLHPDELPYFAAAPPQGGITVNGQTIAFAICYELSVAAHTEKAFENHPAVYITSVAKSVTGVEKALSTLAGTAKQYAVPVLMSNCTGRCDDFDCGGKSSAWLSNGSLAAQLDGHSEGILVLNTATGIADVQLLG
ncbi:carbon-nitrogen hydrolase family protein [Foetidibacter luteolus]|uniref:carbon-nitrogen hydrolase family protein n=1 Tax=Foetidibacter luteolus TaxID=2608880 RepID=UPI00129AEC8D|nr:carbon-nitrogen hydrolase family protein [Foetidibacter luteolus]